MGEDGRISTQKSIFKENEFLLGPRDIHARKIALYKWECVCEKGFLERIYKTVDLPYMTMYICINNVGALVLHKKMCYSFINVRGGCVMAKNTPFIYINGSNVSFPFSVKVIECWEPACKEYVGIFQVLK